MAWTNVAAAGIGLGGSLLGGLFGSSAAKKAAKQKRLGAVFASQHLQQEAPKISAQLREGYELGLGELEPYSQGGGEAFAQLLHGLGIVDLGIGTTAGGFDYGGLIRRFSEDDFVTDPGYQFRQSEGMKGIDRRMAARGLNKSGKAFKALERFNQNLASDEYHRAWTRFGKEQDRQGSALTGLAGTGLNVAGTKTKLHTSHSGAQANLTNQTALNHAALVQSFFGAGAQGAQNQGQIWADTIGNISNIGQGLVGSFSKPSSNINLSLTGSSSSPFTGASYDNSIWTGATPQF